MLDGSEPNVVGRVQLLTISLKFSDLIKIARELAAGSLQMARRPLPCDGVLSTRGSGWVLVLPLEIATGTTARGYAAARAGLAVRGGNLEVESHPLVARLGS